MASKTMQLVGNSNQGGRTQENVCRNAYEINRQKVGVSSQSVFSSKLDWKDPHK